MDDVGNRCYKPKPGRVFDQPSVGHPRSARHQSVVCGSCSLMDMNHMIGQAFEDARRWSPQKTCRLTHDGRKNASRLVANQLGET